MSGPRVLCVSILALVGWPGGATRAEPVLLASLENLTLAGAHAPESDQHVQILLRHESAVAPFEVQELGRDPWWEDGDSGIVDFDSVNEADFPQFAVRLTDGLDETLGMLVLGETGGAGLSGPESLWEIGSPDLVGNELSFIRLIVHQVNIDPYFHELFGEGIQWEAELTYEFWGQPIPEPVTLALLALGGLVVARRTCP